MYYAGPVAKAPASPTPAKDGGEDKTHLKPPGADMPKKSTKFSSSSSSGKKKKKFGGFGGASGGGDAKGAGGKSNKMLNRFVNAAVRVSRSSQMLKRPKDYNDDTSSEEVTSSDDENFIDTKTLMAQSDLPTDFWQVR